MPRWKASLSLVPTPSAEETRTGSSYFPSSLKRPPKPPISPRTLRVNVRWARYLMRCFVRSPAEISTPASAYVAEAGLRWAGFGSGVGIAAAFMEDPVYVVSGSAEEECGGQQKGPS